MNPYEFNPKQNLLDDQLAVSGVDNNIFGFVADVFTGGAYSRNKQAKKQADRTNDYNNKVYDYSLGELERKYNYAVEGQEILKRKTEENLKFQEAQLAQQWNYGMGIRAYEHHQELRAYEQNLNQAANQFTFNEIAERQANTQQNRFVQEQMLAMEFDQDQTLINFEAAGLGLALSRRKAEREAAFATQQTRLEALKATGTARARGQAGRTAQKNYQSIASEAGMRQAQIVEQLLSTKDALDIDFVKLSDQLNLDIAKLGAARDSLMGADVNTRQRIKMQRLQADLDTKASIELKPEIMPPLPKPFALPRPEYQDIYKPVAPPRPQEAVAETTNLFAAAISRIGGAVAAGYAAPTQANTFNYAAAGSRFFG